MSELRLGRGNLVNALLLLVYVGVGLGMTYPLIEHLTTDLPGRTTDSFVHYWNSWWARRALIDGRSPFRTPYLFHPHGLSLVYHNFAWLSILGWLKLRPLLGGFAAYNLVLLVSLGLCGWAAFLLAFDLLDDRRAAFLCGLIYQCWPHRLAQLDHPNLIGTCWIPIFLLFLGRTLSRPRWWSGIMTGVCLALVGYTRWQLLIPASIMGGIYLAFRVPWSWAARHKWVTPLLVGGVIAAVALSPPAMLLLNEQEENPTTLVNEADEVAMQTDLMAYLTPSDNHPVFGVLTSSAYDRYYGDRSEGRRFPAYVGVTTLVLASIGIWRATRKSLPWSAVAAVLVALALGMDLRAGGRLYPTVPMPYRLVRKSFLVRLLRFPDRFSLFLALPMSVLAAQGASTLLKTLDHRAGRASGAVNGLLCGVVIFEFLAVPAPLKRPRRSSFYRELAREAQSYAVLNLPINSQASKEYMLAQTAHQHPILQGKTARLPEDTYSYLESLPFVRSLRRSGEFDPALTDVSRQLGMLADDDVAYILLHKQLVDADRLARWRRHLLTAPRFEDDSIAAFSTSPVAGHDFSLIQEMVAGVGPIEIITSTGCLDSDSALEVDVGWGATEPVSQAFRLELLLESSAGESALSQVSPVTPGWPTDSWPENSVVWGYYPLELSASVPAGDYEVRLTMIDAETGAREGHSVVAGGITISDSRCKFPVPSDVTPVNAVFGHSLRLLGYHVDHRGRELTVQLHWRSEQRMKTDYKIFVHVFEPATSAPVAQDDAMPKRWQYPTTFWGPGETVTDTIPISLEEVPPGAYGLAVGVYDPETTDRLPVRDAKGQLQADGRLVLSEETIRVRERDS